MGWQEINISRYIEQLKISPDEFSEFKQKIQPKLIGICKKFLETE